MHGYKGCVGAQRPRRTARAVDGRDVLHEDPAGALVLLPAVGQRPAAAQRREHVAREDLHVAVAHPVHAVVVLGRTVPGRPQPGADRARVVDRPSCPGLPHHRLQDPVVVARGADGLPLAERADAAHRPGDATDAVRELMAGRPHVAVAALVGRECAQRRPRAVAPHELRIVALVAREVDRRRARARDHRRPVRLPRRGGRDELRASDPGRRQESQPAENGVSRHCQTPRRNYDPPRLARQRQCGADRRFDLDRRDRGRHASRTGRTGRLSGG